MPPKGSSRRGESSNRFPTHWSKWAWNEERQQERRYRLMRAPDDYEFEFRTSTQQGSHFQTNAWNTDVDALSNDFQQTSIDSSAPIAIPQPPLPNSNFYGATSRAPNLGFQQPRAQQYSPQSNTSGAQSAAERRIRTVDDRLKHDELDRRYKVYKSSDFAFGRIFKILWAEPKGAGGTEITARSGRAQSKYGETAFQKIRRFLVVQNHPGHCICIPILTYGGRGTTKNGVHPAHHAAIYSDNHKAPKLHPGETMAKNPIMMRRDTPAETLDPYSRVNYAKTYTVEHNVKVFFIGAIAHRHYNRVSTDYNDLHQPLPTYTPAETSHLDAMHAEGADLNYSPSTGSIPSGSLVGSHAGGGAGRYFPQAPRPTAQPGSYYDSPGNDFVGSGPSSSYPANVAMSTLSPPVVSSTYPTAPARTQQRPAEQDSAYSPIEGPTYDPSLYDP